MGVITTLLTTVWMVYTIQCSLKIYYPCGMDKTLLFVLVKSDFFLWYGQDLFKLVENQIKVRVDE
jgi:hypothetical protein